MMLAALDYLVILTWLLSGVYLTHRVTQLLLTAIARIWP